MPNIWKKHAEDVGKVQTYVGADMDGNACGPTLTWAGANYVCSASGETRMQELGGGGFLDVLTRSVTVLERLWPSGRHPKPGETVTFLATHTATAQGYRVKSSDLLAGGTLRRLTLTSQHNAA